LLYQNIHILQHRGAIAPWNLQQYSFSKNGNLISGKIKRTGSEFSVVFFHFQYVKFVKNNVYDIGWYFIASYIKNIFYIPYLKSLADIEIRLTGIHRNYKKRFTGYNSEGLKNFIKTAFKKTSGYNIVET
jgi:hypothetical protein